MISRWVLIALASWVIGLFPNTAMARLDHYPGFKSVFVASRDVTIWVPEGYDQRTGPLPVIYMHDGQNVFDSATAFGRVSWQVDQAMTQRSAIGAPVAIIVAIANTSRRYREYMPQSLFAALPETLRTRIAASHGGAPLSDNYLRFIVTELKPFVDSHYHTASDARHNSIMGSSMGGLISLYALMAYPEIFGQAACLSIHWPMIGAANRNDISIADLAPSITAMRNTLLASKLRSGPNRIYYDRGDQTLDALYAPYTEGMDALMPTLGWQRDHDWVSRIFTGASHNEASWQKRVAIPIDFLLNPPPADAAEKSQR